MTDHNMPYIDHVIEAHLPPAARSRYLNDALFHHDVDIAGAVLRRVADAMSERGIPYDVAKLVLGDAARRTLADPRTGERERAAALLGTTPEGTCHDCGAPFTNTTAWVAYGAGWRHAYPAHCATRNNQTTETTP